MDRGFGARFFRRAAFFLVFAWGLSAQGFSWTEKELFSSPADQEPGASQFKEVVTLLGNVAWVEAEFAERKELGVLTQPLLSSGRIIFSPDQGLFRKMEHPLTMELIINRKAFVQRDANGEVVRMNVGHLPPAKAFIDLLLAILSGDGRRWGKHFDVFFLGTQTHWQIGFLAKHISPVARGLRQVLISGEGPRFQVVTIVEKNGDQTTTHYSAHHVFLKGDEAISTLPPFPQITATR